MSLRSLQHAAFWSLAAAALLVGLVAGRTGADEPPAPPDMKPRIDINFHEGAGPLSRQPTMRFGIVLRDEKAPNRTASGLKQLTYAAKGETNNTCVRVDGVDRLFGSPPGKWQGQAVKLGKDATGKQRYGFKCVWVHGTIPVEITQTVEIVRGEQTLLLDTCRVHYGIENKDEQPHRVGLRFLLDTFIGTNDGAPFIIPGVKHVCDTQMEFNDRAAVPEFIYALENPQLLSKPGTVAFLKIKLGGKLEAPSRATFGAWPDPDTQEPGALGERTLWNVPVFSMRKPRPPDSAAVLYWGEKPLEAGARRDLGFTYGLGHFSSDKEGRLGLFLAGPFKEGGAMTVLALVSRPKEGQTLTLKPPKGFDLLAGPLTQTVAAPPPDGSPLSPVTWRVRTTQEGIFPVTVESSSGATHRQGVRINKKAVNE
jgi:hypothetical protein